MKRLPWILFLLLESDIPIDHLAGGFDDNVNKNVNDSFARQVDEPVEKDVVSKNTVVPSRYRILSEIPFVDAFQNNGDIILAVYLGLWVSFYSYSHSH